jgi:regulator of RNase E activity RraA
VTADPLAALGEWDTPALSNALDSLRLRPHDQGHSDGSITRITTGTRSAPMVGRAVTARMVARTPGDDAVPVAQLHRAIADADEPVVVVIEDIDDPPGAGAFLGEVNGSLLAALQVVGVVTNGRVRDVDELRSFSYPVYAAGLCVARAHMRLVDVGTVVTVAGMTIHPGDTLHADEHGILQIPSDALPDIIGKAQEIRDEEQAIVAWSRSPEFDIEGLLALRRVRH